MKPEQLYVRKVRTSFVGVVLISVNWFTQILVNCLIIAGPLMSVAIAAYLVRFAFLGSGVGDPGLMRAVIADELPSTMLHRALLCIDLLFVLPLPLLISWWAARHIDAVVMRSHVKDREGNAELGVKRAEAWLIGVIVCATGGHLLGLLIKHHDEGVESSLVPFLCGFLLIIALSVYSGFVLHAVVGRVPSETSIVDSNAM